MTPIDLVDYTKTDAKISSHVLGPKHVQVKIKTWEILCAYAIDYLTIFCSTVTVALFMELAFKNYMVTAKLQAAFANVGFANFALNCLPLIFISYYFFSFFFNHGQTWGMSVMKTRVEMKEHNFRSSFYWAMISSIIMMTAGLAVMLGRDWLASRSWGDFQSHDHLYTNLMQDRNIAPVNLVELSSNHGTKEEAVEENYLEAA
jgi:uncharacterized RDD family membrane protein YckC